MHRVRWLGPDALVHFTSLSERRSIQRLYTTDSSNPIDVPGIVTVSRVTACGNHIVAVGLGDEDVEILDYERDVTCLACVAS